MAKDASQKNSDPYLFLQLLKLATSNLVYNLGLGLSYQKKTTFRSKIGGRAKPGKHPKKMWDPLFISATVKARD